MRTRADKALPKSPLPSNAIPQRQRREAFDSSLTDNRPEAAAHRRFQAMADHSLGARPMSFASNPPVQLGKKGKKTQEEDSSVWKPEHSQEEIQDFMIDLWKKNPTDDQDQLRANYADTYKVDEAGWCDGWSYLLSRGGDELADVWSA